MIAVIAGVTFWSMIRSPIPALRTSRTIVSLPPDQRLGARMPVALSPDGKSLAYATRQSGGVPQLYLRALDQFEATQIPGTTGAQYPFFSPDGQWVGFIANGELQKVSMAGGAPLTICRVFGFQGASWGPEDNIIFGGGIGAGLLRVAALGGTPETLTSPDSEGGEVHHGQPQILPGGKTVLFTIGTGENSHIGVLSLETGEWHQLLRGGTGARYLPTGHLVYSQSGKLRLVPFDLEQFEPTGSAIPILDGVSWGNTGGLERANFTVSETGTLVYVPGGRGETTALVWVDRSGQETSLRVDPGDYLHPRLSPDGRRITLTRIADGGTGDIWIIDTERGTHTRLTVERTSYTPLWTPDGKRVTFVSNGNIFWGPTDGSGEAEPLLIREHYQRPWSWSPDDVLAFDDRTSTGLDIWMLPLDGDPSPFLDTSFNETMPMFSPDGQWLAYVSDDSGRPEVYLKSYPGPGGRWPVSAEGGSEPIWSADGRELFYRNGDRMMIAAVQTKPTVVIGKPQPLFQGSYFQQQIGSGGNYDVSPDGKRFVMIRRDEESTSTQINVVLNWFEELERLVPTP